jgi:hypothetical protein
MKTRQEIVIKAIAYSESIRNEDGTSADHYVMGYNQCQEDMADTQKITRFEVIDENGRVCTRHNCNVELSYQDDGRTLKVFINSLNKQD